MSGTIGLNALQRPLGRGMPLPGGDVIDTPQQRLTLPGGAPGGGGNMPAALPRSSGGVGDMPSPVGGMTFDGSRQTLMEHHLRNKAVLENTGKALKQLDVIRKGLEKLADKQDVITMQDVIEEAGKLVAHGIDPVALAGVLADAPQEGGGEALGGWVQSHAQTAMVAEQNLIQQHNLARYQMGVSAVHLLMAHANAQHLMGGLSPPIGGPQQNGNGNTLAPDADKPIPQDTAGEHNISNSLAMGQRFMPGGQQ